MARDPAVEEARHAIPEGSVVRRVIEVIESHEGIDSPSALFEFFRGSDDEPEIADAVKRAMEEEKEDEMVRLEFNKALCIADIGWCERRMNALIEGDPGLRENAAEYRELQARKEALKQRLKSG